MTSEPVSFSVTQAGEPNLVPPGQDAPLPEDLAEAMPPVMVPGWAPEEASQLAASIFTTGILIAYVARWSSMPDAELWPFLAAQRSEFPQLGTGLAPVLDRFFPKGTAAGVAAASVGVLAGVGELGVAAARRARVVVQVAPKAKQRVEAAQSPQAAAAAPASTEAGYRLPNDLRGVVEASHSPLAGIGIAA